MKKLNKIFFIIFLATALSGCNDYLDEQPRKGNGVELKTFDQLVALLAARVDGMDRQLMWDYNVAQRYMSDCYELPTDLEFNAIFETTEDPTAFHLNCLQPQYTQELTASSTSWLINFKNIYLANTVLTYLDKVTGGTDEQRNLLAKRAHFMRAYHYYELANCYCVPYCEANLNELGLPINTDIEYKESYARSSLKEVYDFIESELKQSLDISTPLIENGVRKVWRENGAAVNGFAARFYLIKGDYAQAKEYAEKALAYNSDLTDYNNSSEIYMDEASDFFGIPYPAVNWYGITMENNDGLLIADYQKSYYRRNSLSGTWAIPSRKFINSFNQEYDMRYRYFYYPDYSGLSLGGMGIFFGFPQIDGYSYICGDEFDSGPCTAEMMLIKAESMARSGQWSEAISYLNTNFRPYRIATDAPSEIKNLSAGNKDEAIAVILKERMLEFPFTLRWHDIRRCNFNDDPNDNISIIRSFYELSPGGIHSPLYDGGLKNYTLDANSNKYIYTLAIPQSEVTISNGVIEQNKY
ncbi:RagB/SusD family nutrient uptake outer membrane protein [Bacteroides congonensis]